MARYQIHSEVNGYNQVSCSRKRGEPRVGEGGRFSKTRKQCLPLIDINQDYPVPQRHNTTALPLGVDRLAAIITGVTRVVARGRGGDFGSN